MVRPINLVAAMLLGTTALLAQGPGGRGGPPMGGGPGGMHGMGMGNGSFDRGSMMGRRSRGLQAGPPGRWWDNKKYSDAIGIQADQKTRMDAIFESSRGNLVSLFSKLRREEEALSPLVGADQPDEGRILAQIDRIAQARAELEKANARMLLGIRRELTADQWHKLEAQREEHDRGGPPPPQE